MESTCCAPVWPGKLSRLRRRYGSISGSAAERAFRALKNVNLKVRPIHHHLADRARAHILLCMLAYYLEWHVPGPRAAVIR